MEKIADTIRKIRIGFYGHSTGTNKDSLTNRIHTFFPNKKTKRNRLKEVEKDYQEPGITHEDIRQRGTA